MDVRILFWHRKSKVNPPRPLYLRRRMTAATTVSTLFRRSTKALQQCPTVCRWCGRGHGAPSISTVTVNKKILAYQRRLVSTTASGEGCGRRSRREIPNDGIELSHFMAAHSNDTALASTTATDVTHDDNFDQGPVMPSNGSNLPYMNDEQSPPPPSPPSTTLKFHLKTYGCQMNVSDSDIVRSILLQSCNSNIKMEEVPHEYQADIILTNTCAIRENAEHKIWHRLRELRALDQKQKLDEIQQQQQERDSAQQQQQLRDSTQQPQQPPQRLRQGKRRIIGVLGCMAERLKQDMFQHGTVDLVAGPDSYRDLPRLISVLLHHYHDDNNDCNAHNNSHYNNNSNNNEEEEVEQDMTNINDTGRVVNVQLSLDETYADIKPVRKHNNGVSAFVSVMRGCNNMCSYCVVPFTRGRERSRDLHSIVEEVTRLHYDDAVMEVVLLGQNVNSYHDQSIMAIQTNPTGSYRTSSQGFSNVFRLRGGAGYYFSDLVDAVSDVSPELRVRFTSPHPKDYPPELLQCMADRHNVCKQLHMPAQSGSTFVLERMRRGYSREAYMELIDTVKSTIPYVAISSDFISGFCGETEEEHADTLSLMIQVAYDQAYMFAYSMRGKTHAHRIMVDDVPANIKNRRLNEVIDVFREQVQIKNDQNEVGRLRLVLVEGNSRKSSESNPKLSGRTDQNKRVVFPREACRAGPPDLMTTRVEEDQPSIAVQPGDYVVVEITEARGHTLRGRALWRTTLAEWHASDHGLKGANLDFCTGRASSWTSTQNQLLNVAR